MTDKSLELALIFLELIRNTFKFILTIAGEHRKKDLISLTFGN